MNQSQIKERINHLIPLAESGEQWAEICRLEDLLCVRCNGTEKLPNDKAFGSDPICQKCCVLDEKPSIQ